MKNSLGRIVCCVVASSAQPCLSSGTAYDPAEQSRGSAKQSRDARIFSLANEPHLWSQVRQAAAATGNRRLNRDQRNFTRTSLTGLQ
ncbi:MAG: hypothetical protein ACYCYO_09220 [Bacilli bacterium]